MQTEGRTRTNALTATQRANGQLQSGGRPTWRHRLKDLSFELFLACDRLGVHVLPKHYYTPIPDYTWLRKNKDAWVRRASLTGVHWNLGEQLAWLTEVCRPYYHEAEGLQLFEGMKHLGPGFGPIESQVLHCVIRTLSPPRIVEIGSGASTAYMLHAVALNRDEGKPESQITCIEPNPRQALRDLDNVTLVEQRCQTVPSSVFAQLQSGDLLFIDSSHAVKIGSELPRIYLDIIPTLPAGVFIHIHDVYLPYLYPRRALLNYFGWQETALILALLTGNERLSALCCLSALHYDHPEKMAALLTDYQPQRNDEGLTIAGDDARHFPASFWLRTG